MGARTLAFVGVLCALPAYRLSALQCPDGSPPPCRAPSARPAVAPSPNSVAVLYFDNLSRDTADAYLAYGITEEIIARLGAVARLEVKSRTAVARYRAARLGPRQLGQALGVAYLVNGAVRRGTARLRVTVELVRASSGSRLWGHQYDRTEGDLLAIEEDIALAVVEAVAGRLAPGERASLAARPTRSPAAYDHFLRGNYYLAQRRAAAVQRAIAEYETAVALDSTFAEAFARIALGYALVLDWGWQAPGQISERILAAGLAAADLAVRRDSTTADAWMARAYLLKFRHPRTYAGVLSALERAITLDPRNAETWHQYASTLLELGDDSAATAAAHRSLELEPERPITLWQLAEISMLQRRDTEQLRWLDSALAIDPSFFIARALRAVTRARLGDRGGALADLETARQLGGNRLYEYRYQAVVYGVLGDSVGARAAAQRILGEVADTAHPTDVEGAFGAAALIAARHGARGLALLERVRPGVNLGLHLRWPEFDPLRADPRFQRLIEESRPK